MAAEPENLSILLNAAGKGDQSAVGELIALVYEQLRALARRQIASEPAGLTLQPTALVNEAYLRLVGDQGTRWENRRHFFGAAAVAMRRILIERARAHAGPKRGGGRRRVPLEDGEALETPDPARAVDWLALDDAVRELEVHDPGLAEVVALRFFAGLSVESAAEVLGVSSRTVNRDWKCAKAWLYDRMTGGPPDGQRP